MQVVLEILECYLRYEYEWRMTDGMTHSCRL